jgi:hypothetical protein
MNDIYERIDSMSIPELIELKRNIIVSNGNVIYKDKVLRAIEFRLTKQPKYANALVESSEFRGDDIK